MTKDKTTRKEITDKKERERLDAILKYRMAHDNAWNELMDELNRIYND